MPSQIADDEENTPLLASPGKQLRIDSRTPSPLCASSTDSRVFAAQPLTPTFAWGPLVALLILGTVKPICFDIIFPFINQMILENGIVNDPEKVGFYSGIIESIFAFMALAAVIPFALMSDHFGRKPIVIFGTIGMAISVALFGLSKSYWMMMVTRCTGGALAASRSTMKVMLAEIYPVKSHRISAFSAFQVAFRIAQMVGQVLGGLLSHPERHMKFFDRPFWREYPFSLPCFVGGALALTACFIAFFTLRESLPSKLKVETRDSDSEALVGADVPTKERITLRSVLTPHVVSILVSMFFMTMVSETFFALYPLFAFTPIQSGGLGLSEAQIGASLASRAFIIVGVIGFSTPLQRYLGPVRTYQIGMAVWPINVIFLPTLNALARTESYGIGTATFNVLLTVFSIFWSIGGLVWPTSQILVIEAPPCPEALATVNGVAQMVSSLGQSIAPAFITTLFAFSVDNHILGGNLVYVVLLLISCVGAAHCLTLKEANPDLCET